jgi:hypothetical protein
MNMANVIGGFGSAKNSGEVPEGRIAIVDRHGRYRGHCGPKMTETSMLRFGIKGPVRLGKFKKRTAWIERPNRG